ncbi:MAG: type II secretion system F family protein [Burkholderiaceae bacterium]|nr:type II secretion system F family protein [Burkholderiaceae bacterium]
MSGWLVVALVATFAAVALSAWGLLAAGSRVVAPLARADLDRLPRRWRIAWPLLARLAPLACGFMGAAHRERLREQLARAGFDASLGPEHFVAGQLALGSATAAGALAAVLLLGSVSTFRLFAAAALGAALGAAFLRVGLHDRTVRRRNDILRQLPHDLDVVTLSVEAGLNLGAALAHAAAQGPPGALRDEWQRVLRDVHAGQPRHEALRAMAARLALPAVSSVVAALVAAERQGASLAPILRAQAEQRRTERFLRAEKLAMEAPVKMLLPLVLFIFPGTFAILLFPIVQRLFFEGVL